MVEENNSLAQKPQEDYFTGAGAVAEQRA